MANKSSRSSKSSSKTSSKSSMPAHVDSNSSVQVRQIQNGFVVSESGYTGKGKNQQYYNKEWFSKSNPLRGITGGGSSGGSGMKFGGKK